MTGTPGGELRARIEALPRGGAVLVVARAPGESGEEAAARAIRVAEAAAEIRAHTFLAAPGGLARALDACFPSDGPGLEAVFAGRCELARIAVPAGGGRGFIVLPSGLPVEAEAPAGAEAASRALRLARTLRRAGGTLVLLLEEETAAGPSLANAVDLLLDGEEEAATEPDARDEDERTPEAAEEAAPPEDGRWRRHRKRSGPPVGRVVAGIAALLAVAAGWWIAVRFLEGAGEKGTASGGTAVAIADTATAPDTADAGAAPPDTAAAAGTRARPDSARQAPAAGRIADDAPALPYSVLIASYATREDAEARARRWARQDGTLYLVAPTPVQDRLYYRLFAGALPDRQSAGRLMRQLVDRGRKDEARAWDVRPASLAFRLGIAASRGRAEARADSLGAAGIPAYVLPAVAGSDTAWQVYSGAFESEAAAAAVQAMIRKAGGEAHLVTRRGTTG